MEFPGKKEVIVIDEDLFPPIASINTTTFDFKAMLNAKEGKEFSPNT